MKSGVECQFMCSGNKSIILCGVTAPLTYMGSEKENKLS